MLRCCHWLRRTQLDHQHARPRTATVAASGREESMGPALTHGGTPPLVTLHLTGDEASVGAVSKTQLGKGRVDSLPVQPFGAAAPRGGSY